MRTFLATVVAVVVLCVSGCGSPSIPVMPDVTGKKLDEAKASIKEVGFDEDVKVDGGGVFGIFTESNWEVCKQKPKAGAPFDSPPKLAVKRSCEKKEPNPAPNATDSATATATPTSASPAPSPKVAADKRMLTPGNNSELAALLKLGDDCDERISTFAKKYADRVIEFNASVVNVASEGILIAPGDNGPNSTSGPVFKILGKDASEGALFRLKAQVGEFNEDQCLFYLASAALTPR